MFLDIATLKRNNSMETSKTVEELMKDIMSLAKDIDWDNSEGKGVICFAHEENETMCMAYGQYSSVACAITNMMIDDENIRDIMCLAYKAYVDYSAKNLAKVYGPVIEAIDNVVKENLSSEPSSLAPAVFSAKFKRRN